MDVSKVLCPRWQGTFFAHMYAIRMPSGEFLEGAVNIQFDLNNRIFVASSGEVAPVSYTFAVDFSLAGQSGTRHSRCASAARVMERIACEPAVAFPSKN